VYFEVHQPGGKAVPDFSLFAIPTSVLAVEARRSPCFAAGFRGARRSECLRLGFTPPAVAARLADGLGLSVAREDVRVS
jgi:hypothetical protein